jgi:DNA-binding beta-propeller fold protein YncE
MNSLLRHARSIAVLFAAWVVLPVAAHAAAPPFVRSWHVTGASGVSSPFAIAVDDAGHVFVTEGITQQIIEYTDGGVFVRQWGGFGSGPGQMNTAEGIAVAGGRVYVADTWNHRVEEFTTDGVFVRQWGGLGKAPGLFHSPVGIALDPSGTHVYVADQIYCRVQEFDTTGTFIRTWGQFGHGNNDLGAPYGLTVDANGDVYVTDANSNCRVVKYSSTGSYLTQWGSCYVNNADTQFTGPFHVAKAPGGQIYVADGGANTMKEFTNTGALIVRWGANGQGERCSANEFASQRGVAVDMLGNIYVADTSYGCIEVYGPGGTTPTRQASWGGLKTYYR